MFAGYHAMDLGEENINGTIQGDVEMGGGSFASSYSPARRGGGVGTVVLPSMELQRKVGVRSQCLLLCTEKFFFIVL